MTKTKDVQTPINSLTEAEIDLALEALDLLENQPTGIPGLENGFSGYVVGTSQEDVRAQVDQKVNEVRVEIKDRKRRIILLKAKLVLASMNTDMNTLFAPQEKAAL